jgi:hypothetical protein
MIDQETRKAFIKYLNKLIDGRYSKEDWLNYIIEHKNEYNKK